ncbi:MAG TPA: serine hydrolase domain-containing protein [Acidimicrobiia bacterium]|jgi:D-alanyl-D-alanine carboxypeptidase
MRAGRRVLFVALVPLVALALATANGAVAAATEVHRSALDQAIARLAATHGGPPGIAVVVDRGGRVELHTGGVADRATGTPFRLDDRMRVASVAKAFSGATALSVVARGRLSLDTTIGERLPMLPRAWWPVTLAELLGHTSGIPDFSMSSAFVDALRASLTKAPPPLELLRFVFDRGLEFAPGTKYEYSNSDNIVVALLVEAATGRRYASVLDDRVTDVLGLSRTTLPDGPLLRAPFVHGYEFDPPATYTDVSQLFAAGWTWASGGVVSTPRELDRFIRAYARGKFTDPASRARQFTFIRGGSSEPPGPGTNSAGLALFRYETRCGTVYGHTGNTPGYTQFAAATRDGSRSVTVSLNAQITPKSDPVLFLQVRRLFELATCAALQHDHGRH